MVRSARGVLVAGALGASLIGALWLWRASDAPAPAAPAAPAARPEPERSGAAREAPAPRWEARRAPAPSGVVPVRAAPVVPAAPQHLIDPCTELARVAAPADFEQVEAHGVTVAWAAGPAAGPRDMPLRPLALAHLVAGLLEEAAQLTGTQRRVELLVVVYPSRDELQASAKAPSWAAGVYDGAVRVPLDPRGDLGVSMSTLRHEVMHAQLHAAVGCMPVWFNEGAAMYFAGTAPVREWIELLRTAPPLELGVLEGPVLDDGVAPQVDRVYAQSFAMLLLAAERSGGLAPAVLALSDANRGSPREGREVWSRLAPRADLAAVLDALARRIFGAPLPELGGILDGALCCHGLARAPELTCRSAPARSQHTWLDAATTPNAVCRARW